MIDLKIGRYIQIALPAMMMTAPTALWAEKPLIGINSDYRDKDNYQYVNAGAKIFDAVSKAGGLPVIIPPVESKEDIARYVEMVDGFVFAGGSDLNPSIYGEEKYEATNLIHTRRETFDLEFMRQAMDSKKPVLAICLGMQEMSVVHGGTLIQDIPTETSNTIPHKGEGATHDIAVTVGSQLSHYMGGNQFHVNSIHHQSIDNPGNGVSVSAKSADGIIEGIEIQDHPFAIGVQWHPEYLTSQDPHLNLFRGLVKAASKSGDLAIIQSPIAEDCYGKWEGVRKIDTVVVHFTSAVNWFAPDFQEIVKDEGKQRAAELNLTKETLAEYKYDWLLNKAIFEVYHVSSHYGIARDGTIVQFVADNDRAWHAGKSAMPNDKRENVNDFSIGIELMASHPDDDSTVKTAADAYTEAQYDALNSLIAQLCADHGIKFVVGHDEIAPGRKKDPGPLFQWDRVRDKEYAPIACK